MLESILQECQKIREYMEVDLPLMFLHLTEKQGSLQTQTDSLMKSLLKGKLPMDGLDSNYNTN